MKDSGAVAEIRVHETARGPAIHIGVPRDTKVASVAKLLDLVSADVLPGLVGCEACNSGVPIWIDNIFEDVIRVDLGSFQRIR
jgi:hypothetical protein